MEVIDLPLSGLKRICPKVHGDTRGFFLEAFNAAAYVEAGIPLTVLQHNQSRSQKSVVRGLHFQWDKPLDKLIRVTRGRAFTVAVDIRKGSPTFGSWHGHELSEENKEEIFAPFGFATGFCALEDNTEVEYYYSAYYNQAGESNIAWNDPDIAIAWPITHPVLSERDSAAQSLKAWIEKRESDLF